VAHPRPIPFFEERSQGLLDHPVDLKPGRDSQLAQHRSIAEVERLLCSIGPRLVRPHVLLEIPPTCPLESSFSVNILGIEQAIDSESTC
jgi:hypothetical protein